MAAFEEQIQKIRFREKSPQSHYMLPVTRRIINLTGFSEETLQKILKNGRKYE